MRLRTQLKKTLAILWSGVFFCGLCTAIGWFWLSHRTYSDEFANASRESQIANDAFVEHTLQVVRQADTALRAVRSYYLCTHSLEETERFIDHLALNKSLFDNIYLLSAQGQILIAHDPAARGKSITDRDYFHFHRDTPIDQLYIGSVESSRVTGKYHFRITRRISTADGAFDGIVLMTLEPRAFSDYYRRLIASTDSVASLLGIHDRKLRARIPDPPTEAWQMPVPSIVWDALAQSPFGAYESRSVIDHIERHFLYQTVGDFSLVMVTGFSDADVKQRAARQMLPMTLAIMGGIIIIILLAITVTVIAFQQEKMRALAITDTLTGLFNRRYVMEVGEKEIARARRYHHQLAVLMLDIDHFKTVNDTWGHPTGDQVIQALAQLLVANVRDQDIVGRIGGEEFIVIMPETHVMGNQLVSERIRVAVEAHKKVISPEKQPIRFTVSIGVVTLAPDETAFNTLLSRADKALYTAKESGRNCVVMG